MNYREENQAQICSKMFQWQHTVVRISQTFTHLFCIIFAKFEDICVLNSWWNFIKQLWNLAKYPLSELGQTMMRGESNILVSVYDESLKETVMKAIMVYDADLDVRVEGKFISIKMGITKQENRNKIAEEAKKWFTSFKSYMMDLHRDAGKLLKNLELIVDNDEVKSYKDQMEESYKKHIKLGEDALSKKVSELKGHK